MLEKSNKGNNSETSKNTRKTVADNDSYLELDADLFEEENVNKFEVVNLEEISVDKNALSKIDLDLIVTHLIFPFRCNGREVYVALVGMETERVLKKMLDQNELIVRPFLAEKDSVEMFIAKYYFNSNFDEFKKKRDDINRKNSEHSIFDSNTGILYEDEYIKRENVAQKISEDVIGLDTEIYIKKVIKLGVDINASSIHIEERNKLAYIRYRVDGKLILQNEKKETSYDSIAKKIKVMAALFTEEREHAQKGYASLKVDNNIVSFNVLTMPTANSEKIVVKLNSYKKSIRIEDIGFSEEDRRTFMKIIEKESGLFIISGLAGSGRTTSFYATIKRLISTEKNIITIEDEIADDLTDVSQISLVTNDKRNLSQILGNIDEYDPDIIGIDLRDVDMANYNTLFKLSRTGRFVIITMNFTSTLDVIRGLISMGFEPFYVASSLKGIMTQSLAKRTCSKCKGKKKDDNNKICINCNGSGYKDTIAIFEIINMGRKYFSQIVYYNDNIQELKEMLDQEPCTFEKNSIRLYKEGILSKEEIRKLGIVNS